MPETRKWINVTMMSVLQTEEKCIYLLYFLQNLRFIGITSYHTVHSILAKYYRSTSVSEVLIEEEVISVGLLTVITVVLPSFFQNTDWL